jgi:hypothetical protein
MSGKGDSTRGNPVQSGGRERAEAGADRCDLDLNVELSAVRPQPLRQLAVGSTLAVDLAAVGNLQAVVCKTPTADVVGTLAAFEGLADLIDCIRRGNSYSATVLRLSGASCAVHVQRTGR